MYKTSGVLDDDLLMYSAAQHPNETGIALNLARQMQANRNAAKAILAQIREEEHRSAAVIEQLSSRLAELQHSECGHEMQKHHPDPSGNNDSWRECLICGAMI